MKKQLPGWAVLLIITLVAGLALGGTYALTKGPIDEQSRITAENARKAALPNAETFEQLTLAEGAPVDWAYAGLATVKGKTMPLTLEGIDALAGATYTSTAVVNALNDAYQQYKAAPSDQAFTAEAQGFAGPVAVEATFDGDAITSLKIGDDRFAETQGFGARALEDEFQSQFLSGSKAVGYVAQTTVNGFGGEVEVIAGVDASDPASLTLGGISVGGANFSETAGLGARSKEPAFAEQFVGKATPVKFIKSGEEDGDNTIHALTSATITTTAVVNGVNNIVKYVKSDIMGITGAEMPARPDDSLVFSSSAKGFRGPVYVEAAFDANHQVTYMSVGDDQFAEDIGAGVKEADFMYQFIGKAVPLTLSDIEAISGATISSTAVVNALNQAYELSTGAEVAVPETPALPEKPADGVYSAAEQGFAGPVYVEAAFDAEGKISYIGVGDDAFAETAGFGARALEAEEQIQFIGKQMPLALEDVDALSGATFTKTAVVNGLNKAYNASQGIVEEEPAAVETPTMPEKPETTYTAEADGFAGPVAVEAAFSGNTVAWLNVGDGRFSETAGFGARALEVEEQVKFVGKQLPLKVEDVDALAGATFTKTAIVNALNKAYEKAAAPAVEEPAVEKLAVEEPAAEAAGSAVQASGLTGKFDVNVALNEDGTVKAVTLGESDSDMDKTYLALANTDAFLGQFVGKALPVSDVDVAAGATVSSKAIIEAVNSFAVPAAEEPTVEEPAAEEPVAEEPVAEEPAAEEPAAEEPVAEEPAAEEPAAEEPAAKEPTAEEPAVEKLAAEQPAGYVGEAVAFFDAVKADAAFDGDVITSLSLSQKAVGAEAYGPFALEAAFQEKLIGASAPVDPAQLDVDAPEYVKTAVALAVNEAFAQATGAEGNAVIAGTDGPTAVLTAEKKWYSGEAVIFFTEIRADAAFDANVLTDLALKERPVGGAEYASMALEAQFQQALIGKTVPLDQADVDGAREYTAAAVVIAVNEAYAQSLAGQQ